ncbi:MAG: amidohydrolase [Tissierellia bacterium]|nr:amidohydrolase [Tissierellia bacterium]
MDILAISKEVSEDVIKWRRDLHQIPEVGNDLPKTADYVSKVLDDLGVEYTSGVGLPHGILARIKGGKKGKTIALRADMDACGHDAQTAILLGTIKILNNLKENLTGEMAFLFQPSDDISSGAKPMIEAGALKGVDRIIGLHVGNVFPADRSGKVFYSTGGMMGDLDKFTIKVKGKGTHGAYPHEGVDPIVVASYIINGIQAIVARELDPVDPGVITFGVFNGGEVNNIIPEEVMLEGTSRAVNHKTRAYMKERIGEIAEGIAKSHRAEVEYLYYLNAPPLVNDKTVAEELAASAKKVLGKELVEELRKPVMGGEDFAYYLEEVPGAYLFISNPLAIDGVCYAQHNPKFALDESVLYRGVACFVQHVFDYLV